MIENEEDVLRSYRVVADRVMLATLGFLLLVCLGIAANTGAWSSVLLVGIPAFVIPALLMRMSPATLISRLAVAAAFMVFSALMIQQTHGMVETHFGIFVLLAFLLYYRDWRPIILAAGVIAVHHLVFFWLQSQGYGVYVIAGGSNLEIVLLHAVYVVFESAVLVYLTSNMRAEALEGARVSALAAAISNGDLTMKIDVAKGSSLIGAVSIMRDNLSGSLGQVREQAEILSAVAEKLSDSNRLLVADAEQESQSVAAMAAAIEELTASINHLSENAAQAKHLSQQSGRTTTEGSRVVQTAIDEIKGIASTIEDASRNVQQLGEKSDRVSQVVGLIKEVAGQTNLLALNAAIEAARAGEQGRGFAVVADEVRKLAERTSQATEEISLMMTEMQDSKSATLESIQQAVSMVNLGVEHTAAVGRTITDISAQVAGVESAVADISDGMREQSIAATDIAKNVERTAQLVVQTARATAENMQELEGIRASAAVLRGVVSKFRVAPQTS
ncbi:MAG: methyl-accepting chemotaxis protein [Betaproteobacteria bacterium]|nr:methyl-accepting chemotaxis protein [Betaproteobacteria bacterium]